MKNITRENFKGLSPFFLLWSTQTLSGLGSSMTAFALILWSYTQRGSALLTALLTVCSYVPYVLLSIFAGTLGDRWNKKKILLLSDGIAALTTLCVFLLMQTGALRIWHLYVLNALNGFMNSVQQPVSDVTVSLIAPKERYQTVSGLSSFSSSLITVLTPAFTAALTSFLGIQAVLAFDLLTFFIAFAALAFFIRIPGEPPAHNQKKESLLVSAKEGFAYLKRNRGILSLILFLAVINLIASLHQAARPVLLLSREGGGEAALGVVNTCMGLATILGSLWVSLKRPPKSRVRLICNTLLFSMGTENFLFAFGRSVPVWCLGSLLGWIVVPVMSANMSALFRSYIPLSMQGRVYAVRNTLQYFTIPIGYLLGGLLIDRVFEPLMAAQEETSLLVTLFGGSKGAGAALFYLLLGVAGVLVCLIFRKDPHIWRLEETDAPKPPGEA